MSDRMAVMNRGGLEQVGPKLEVYNTPATRFVASFVGAPNKLRGQAIDGEGERLRVDWQGITLTGRAGSGARAGDAVEMYLKSERIAIDPADDAVRDENRLDGTVRDIIFKGQFADYFVRTANEEELVVSAPPALPGIARGRGGPGVRRAAASLFHGGDAAQRLAGRPRRLHRQLHPRVQQLRDHLLQRGGHPHPCRPSRGGHCATESGPSCTRSPPSSICRSSRCCSSSAC